MSMSLGLKNRTLTAGLLTDGNALIAAGTPSIYRPPWLET